MDNLSTTQTAGTPATLNNLAMQAKMFASQIQMSALQLGRVLTEAKPLVGHGDWQKWVDENAGMSIRSAQGLMQAYNKYGLDPAMAALGTTKLMKLLPLSEDESEKLLTENDVSAMSTREMDAKIKEIKAQAEREAGEKYAKDLEKLQKKHEELNASLYSEIDKAHEAQRHAENEMIAANKRADEAESRPPVYETPPEIKKMLTEAQTRLSNAERGANAANSERERLAKENSRLKEELEDQNLLIAEQQEEMERVSKELLNAKSIAAKGDAERVPTGQLTLDVFASAVRTFVGSVARMPHMASAFAMMASDDKAEYDELLRTIESWTQGARSALEAQVVEGMVID